MQKQSYKEQEKQRRESEILRLAGEMLAERGYANLNMDELAEVVGISKPTLYQHFKGKEELVCHVIANSMESFSTIVVEDEGTPIERITKMMRTMAKGRTRSTGLWGTVNADIVWKVFRDNPLLIQQRQKFGEKVRDLVDEAKAAGEISAALPTLMVVRLIFGLQMMLGDPMLPQPSMSDEEVEQALDNMIAIFLHGVSPQ